MAFFDFLDLDKRVAALALSLRRRARAMSDGTFTREEDVDFARSVSSKETFDALGELGADPFAGALRAWVGRLAVERVTSADIVRLYERRSVPSTIDEETHAVRALVGELLGTEREARAAIERLPRFAPPVGEAARLYAERRAEARRRLGFDADPTSSAVASLVEDVLARTDAALDATGDRGRSWLDVMRRSIASDAGEGWPAKMTPIWFRELLGRGELLRGVSLDVTTLPSPLGVSSFARALTKVGEAWAFHDRPAHAPFSLSREPDDPLVARRAALFGSLVLEPRFHERKLGLGRERARDQARAVGRSALLWIRSSAFRAAAWPLVVRPPDATFEELAERTFGRPLPRVLLGVLPSLSPGAGSELVASLAAFCDREQLRDQFDEDWFDNPRAHEALRHENQVPVAQRLPAPAAEALGPALSRRIAELLDG